MKLSEIVSAYIEHLPAGVVLSNEDITKNLRRAVRFYAGYAGIESLEGQSGVDITISPDNQSQDIELSVSEYSIIQPLFYLYVEQENAMHLEASRGLGLDVYGRSSESIVNDIIQLEADMPHKAFFHDMESV